VIVEWLVLLTFVLSFLTSIFSGMGGGGGGFVMTPYFLFIGLPPANAIATMKLVGIGTTVGSIAAFQGKGLIRTRLVIPFMAIILVCALISAWIIPRLDPLFFEKFIGALLLVMIPTLFIKKAAFQPGKRSRAWIVMGFVAYTLFAFLQTLLGTGMGTLVVLVLMFLFGLSALEANATKRAAGIVQGVLLLILLGIQGLVVWTHAIAGGLGSVIGSHIGARIAIKKGDQFVKIILAVVMLASGIALLMG
jgi:uncharacterized membrane protein YfcA